MSTPAAPVAAAAPAKVSWLKKVGQVLGKILGFVSNDAAKIASIAAPVAEALLPQFSSQIAAADGLVTNIAKEAVAVEGAAAAAGTASGTGTAKLAAVLANVGPAIDNWVSSAFPGAAAVSAASKAGLVNAVVAIMNEVQPAATDPVTTASTAAS